MPRIKSTKASLMKTLTNKVQEYVDVILQSMGEVKQKWNYLSPQRKIQNLAAVKKINDFINDKRHELPVKVQPSKAKHFKYCPFPSNIC